MTVHPQVTKATIPGIVNFSRIAGKEGFGGATEPSAMNQLQQQGFATVINLQLASEPGVDVSASRMAAQAAGLAYIHLPFDPTDPEPDLVDSFLAAVTTGGNEPVYIHCASATRVASLWMIRRVLKDGWNLKEAEEEASAIAAKPSEAIAFAGNYITSQGS